MVWVQAKWMARNKFTSSNGASISETHGCKVAWDIILMEIFFFLTIILEELCTSTRHNRFISYTQVKALTKKYHYRTRQDNNEYYWHLDAESTWHVQSTESVKPSHWMKRVQGEAMKVEGIHWFSWRWKGYTDIVITLHICNEGRL
jgi:hypothetical protein